METVTQFVQRTQGPVVPFVPDWYPWVYAHHYLRLEARELPAGLGRDRTSLTTGEAIEVIQLWCALSGESIESAARELADAYLRRWGLADAAGARQDDGSRPAAQARAEGAPDEGTPGAGQSAVGAPRKGAPRKGATSRASTRRRTGRIRQLHRRAVRRERARTVTAPVPAGRRASAGS